MTVASDTHNKARGLRLTVVGLLLTTFVLALFLAQVLTGTPVPFAGLVSLFTVLGIATVKILGGPTTLPGLLLAVGC